MLESADTVAALQRFREMGRLLYEDPKGEYEIIAGDVFECPTVKGGTNLIVALRIYNGQMFYAQGDKVRKTPLPHFLRAIDSGDITYRNPKEIDVERLSMAVIALDAIANRRSFEQSVCVMEEQMTEQLSMGNTIIS